jgi:hypothetical protein
VLQSLLLFLSFNLLRVSCFLWRVGQAYSPDSRLRIGRLQNKQDSTDAFLKATTRTLSPHLVIQHTKPDTPST